MVTRTASTSSATASRRATAAARCARSAAAPPQLGLGAWICGLRSGQGVTRQQVEIAEWDQLADMVKINPLASWDEARVWEYIRANDVPYNPLHDQGFPSIGCAPCTRAVAEGEDWRAGRWWWELPEHRECGLHDRAARTPGAPPTPPPAPEESRMNQLDTLEAKSVHILREAYANFGNLCMLWSIGKDSTVLLLAGAQGVLRPRAVSAGAHRHRLQDAGDDRVPRPAGARVAPRPDRTARTAEALDEQGRPSPTARSTASRAAATLKTDGAQAHARAASGTR